MGKTGQAILRAIVAGERDGAVLAGLRDGRVKADERTIARSLEGTWREEHLFAPEQALERYDFFTAQIQACEARMDRALTSLASDTDLAESAAPRLAAPARATRERACAWRCRRCWAWISPPSPRKHIDDAPPGRSGGSLVGTVLDFAGLERLI